MIKYKNFLITEENGKLNFKNLRTGQVKKGIKIVYDRSFVFKVQKSQIKTKYATAEKFLEWLQFLVDENFSVSYISQICESYVGKCDYDFAEDKLITEECVFLK